MKTSYLVFSLACVSTLGFAAQTKKPKPQPQAASLGAGFVQAAALGTKPLTLDQVPETIRFAADLALAGYGQGAKVTGAQIDLDDVLPIYEIEAVTADGRHIEVDVQPDGRIEEIEIQLNNGEVPAAIMDAMNKQAPDFQPTTEEVKIEKSLRPSKNGLIEVWYEFGGTSFDIEVRSDAKALLIEPA